MCMICPYPLKSTVLRRWSCLTVELPPRAWQSPLPERDLTLKSPRCRATSQLLGLRPSRKERTTLARFEYRARSWDTAVSRSDATCSGACVVHPPYHSMLTTSNTSIKLHLTFIVDRTRSLMHLIRSSAEIKPTNRTLIWEMGRSRYWAACTALWQPLFLFPHCSVACPEPD